MDDYRIEAATKEEWASRAFNAELKIVKAIGALRLVRDRHGYTPRYLSDITRAALAELEK